ncbi:MAG: type II toxin-antitoxin system PemK/MazF family toxin [Dolichospermum sp.]|jgi:mRNA interferase MazF|uniref:Type II toxin-antitoxin system PemK/MazF family toxin n=2 Tax=Dolichospermum TaxID=748770 RepID=A0A6H2BUP7_DOLFA|nr:MULTISPECIES: type II toxin-antitoxin system PemK/MazF family toxin [Dolichospermum]MDB9435902.1 type II toxin-antitoxin system PemK/MazF family toxin [Dolichospermum lemmermannii CS-548]MDM3857206.1 type II toxin-antitoxin system PemK/MazF family toxin [Aphanizomenon gracile PMC649.10]QJB42893.1 type II toxin-antitoxin system PemK/MazF family toxin [Dolichospermum flos-aquae CCAP 1403/13F]
MPYNRGSVVLVLFPDSNLKTAKRRPALVVQSNNIGTGLSQTIIAMITSNVSRAGHPSRVFVNIATPEGKQTGLITDSVIMTDNLATVLDTEIDKVIGFWSEMSLVDAALRHTLEIL